MYINTILLFILQMGVVMTLVNSRSVGFFVARKFDDCHVTCQNTGGYPRILYAVVCYYFSIIIINIIVNYYSSNINFQKPL